MAESPRRVDLRLTIPAAAPFRTVATEVAEKFAEHAGAANPKSVADGLASSLAEVARSSPAGTDILIEMSSQNGGVAINASSGSTPGPTTTRPNRN
jgi:hypothetical protein